MLLRTVYHLKLSIFLKMLEKLKIQFLRIVSNYNVYILVIMNVILWMMYLMVVVLIIFMMRKLFMEENKCVKYNIQSYQ